MFLFVLEIMLKRVPEISQRFSGSEFRGESIVDRRQDLLLDFV